VNFGNDFGAGSTLVGWGITPGDAPGTVLGITTQVAIAGGALVIDGSAPSAYLVVPDTAVGVDMEVETVILRAGMDSGTDITNQGVLLRYTATQLLIVTLRKDGTLSIDAFNGTDWLAGGTTKLTLPPGDLRLKVQAIGDKVRCFINGLEVFVANTTILGEGRVGLRWYTVAPGTPLFGEIQGRVKNPNVSGGARIDCEYEVLKAAGYPGTISEKELAWLRANGAVSKTIPDAWNEFLTAQGQPATGTLIDRRHNWLLGMIGVDPGIGSTWLDLWKAFWCEFGGDIGGTPGLGRDPFFTTPLGTVWQPVEPAHAIYTNDFSGTPPNDLTGWTGVNTLGVPSGPGAAAAFFAEVSGGRLVSTANNGMVIPPVSGLMTDFDISVNCCSTQTSGVNWNLYGRLDTALGNGIRAKMVGSIITVSEYKNSIETQLGLTLGMDRPSDGVTLRMKVVGSQVSLYQGGTLLGTRTTTLTTPGASALLMYSGAAPVPGVILYDDFSVTSLDTFYFYDTADFTAFVTGAGLSQSGEKTPAPGTPGTFHVRLREKKTSTTSVDIYDGPTLLGTVVIGAGQVYGTNRFVIGAGSTGNFKFILASAVVGMAYVNDFSGTGGNDLVGWEYSSILTPLAPVTSTNAILVGGDFTPLQGVSFFPPAAKNRFADGDLTVEGYTAGLSSATDAGLICRWTETGFILVAVTTAGGTSVWENTPTSGWVSVANSGATVMEATFKLKAVLYGDTIQVFLNGVKTIDATLPSVLGEGRFGWMACPTGTGLANLASLTTTSGGVSFESFTGGVTAADGGIPQSLDPYFNAPATWNNTGTGASVAGNQGRLPAGVSSCYVGQATPAFAAGDIIEVRVYISQLSPGAFITFECDFDYGAMAQRLSLGWNALTYGPLTAGDQMSVIQRGPGDNVTDTLIDFCFAWKV